MFKNDYEKFKLKKKEEYQILYADDEDMIYQNIYNYIISHIEEIKIIWESGAFLHKIYELPLDDQSKELTYYYKLYPYKLWENITKRLNEYLGFPIRVQTKKVPYYLSHPIGKTEYLRILLFP
jgi:hypothetical protein